MTILEGVQIQNDNYGVQSTISNANLNNCIISGGSVLDTSLYNPTIELNANTTITIEGEMFTAKDLLEAVKALKKIREIYPEVFI